MGVSSLSKSLWDGAGGALIVLVLGLQLFIGNIPLGLVFLGQGFRGQTMALQPTLLGNKRVAGVTKVLLLSFAVLLGAAHTRGTLWQQYARDDRNCTKSFLHGTESWLENCRRQLDRLRTQQQKTLTRTLAWSCGVRRALQA